MLFHNLLDLNHSLVSNSKFSIKKTCNNFLRINKIGVITEHIESKLFHAALSHLHK